MPLTYRLQILPEVVGAHDRICRDVRVRRSNVLGYGSLHAQASPGNGTPVCAYYQQRNDGAALYTRQQRVEAFTLLYSQLNVLATSDNLQP